MQAGNNDARQSLNSKAKKNQNKTKKKNTRPTTKNQPSEEFVNCATTSQEELNS